MIKKPKILVFAHEQYLNGASHSLLAILEGLQASYEFRVIVPDKGMMVDELIKIGIPYQIMYLPRCGYFNWVSPFDHLKKAIRYIKNSAKYEKQLLLLAREFAPDVVYTNTSVLSFGYDLSRKINKPHIWHIREYGNKDFKIEYLPSNFFITKKIKKSSISIFTTNLLRKHWLGIAKNNSEVVYNGVTASNEGIINDCKSGKEFTIAVVGNIIKPKNQEFALKIFKELYQENKKLQLKFYGSYSGDYYIKMMKYIKKHNLNDVVCFVGYVSNDKIYNEIDLLLSCSENEAFGRTIIEAMSNGIPVLSKNIGGPSEILNKIKGLTLYDSFEEAIFKLNKLITDSKFYNESSLKGYNLAKTNFSKQSYLNNMDEIFKNTLHE
jgi:L-malate glycosyltransferase